MLRAAALAGALIFSASCTKSEGGDIGALQTATKPGSGGFSSDLAKELGAGSAKADDTKPADGKAAAGKAADGKAADGKAADGKASGDGKAADSKAAAETKVASESKAGDGKSLDAKAGAKTEPEAKTAADVKAGAGIAKTEPVAVTDAKTQAKDPGAKGAKPAATAMTPSAPVSHGPARVPTELAAIKLSLLPNWDRDIDEAGTFQYVVRIKGTQSTKTFSFHYGYDDPKAPGDRDQYKKYLQETGGLTGEIKDRQRGGAWFLEGSDATGPAFRYVVLYGGKRLICYGSLYKDVESNKLGDDRDQTLIQAKQICETLAL